MWAGHDVRRQHAQSRSIGTLRCARSQLPGHPWRAFSPHTVSCALRRTAGIRCDGADILIFQGDDDALESAVSGATKESNGCVIASRCAACGRGDLEAILEIIILAQSSHLHVATACSQVSGLLNDSWQLSLT